LALLFDRHGVRSRPLRLDALGVNSRSLWNRQRSLKDDSPALVLDQPARNPVRLRAPSLELAKGRL